MGSIPHKILIRTRADWRRVSFPTRIEDPGNGESIILWLLRHFDPYRREIPVKYESPARRNRLSQVRRDGLEFRVELIGEIREKCDGVAVSIPGSLPEEWIVPESG